MKNGLKHKQGLERIKKIRSEAGYLENQEPFPQSDQELVDEISLEIEVKDIMDEVNNSPV